MAIGGTVLLDVVFKQLSALIDLIGRLADHFVNSDSFEGSLGVPNETTRGCKILARNGCQERVLPLVSCNGSIIGVWCRIENLIYLTI